MKNIHIIPTDKPSEFYSINGKHKLANSTMAMDWYISSVGYKPHNIYITSDEEIKEGDWIKWGEAIYKANKKYTPPFKKIILTTDQDLIEYGVQAIDDEFLEWFVKNPSCESVEVSYEVLKPFQSEEKGYLIHYPDNEVLEEPKQLTDLEIAIKLEEIQREEPKQETFEEAALRLYPIDMRECENSEDWDINKQYRDEWVAGTKWQQERMYSEEEVIAFGEFIFKHTLLAHSKGVENLFEQFKKK